MRRRKKRRREKAKKAQGSIAHGNAHTDGDEATENGNVAAGDEDSTEAADELVLLQVCCS